MQDKDQRSPTVMALAQLFNALSTWVSVNILCESEMATRVLRVVWAVDLCSELLRLQDLQGAFAVMSSLRSASIFRLTETCVQLPKRTRRIFEQCESVLSLESNLEGARKLLRKAKGPCVPFIGLYLSGLMNIECARASGATRRPTNDNQVVNLSGYPATRRRCANASYTFFVKWG